MKAEPKGSDEGFLAALFGQVSLDEAIPLDAVTLPSWYLASKATPATKQQIATSATAQPTVAIATDSGPALEDTVHAPGVYVDPGSPPAALEGRNGLYSVATSSDVLRDARHDRGFSEASEDYIYEDLSDAEPGDELADPIDEVDALLARKGIGTEGQFRRLVETFRPGQPCRAALFSALPSLRAHWDTFCLAITAALEIRGFTVVEPKPVGPAHRTADPVESILEEFDDDPDRMLLYLYYSDTNPV